MTKREQEILSILRDNPRISQNELAVTLGITRSSAAVHITNLMKKGYILGKGYLLKEAPYVCVIGGANIDIQGCPARQLVPRDSNIGVVKTSLGGVGRNIAENLARLTVDTKLLSVVGDDAHGERILEEARHIGLDMTDTLRLRGASTSVYLSILDESRDMAVAINSMAVFEQLTVEYLKSKRHVLDNAVLCVLDTNLPEETLAYILTTHRGTPIYVDPVSAAKATRIKDLLGGCHTIKPNRLEAEILSGVSIRDNSDLEKACAVLHGKGVTRVFLSLGSDGVYCSTPDGNALLPPPKVTPVNATGAGDAFMAALVYASLQGYDSLEAGRLATAAAALALCHEETINPTLSPENLLKRAKELQLC